MARWLVSASKAPPMSKPRAEKPGLIKRRGAMCSHRPDRQPGLFCRHKHEPMTGLRNIGQNAHGMASDAWWLDPACAPMSDRSSRFHLYRPHDQPPQNRSFRGAHAANPRIDEPGASRSGAVSRRSDRSAGPHRGASIGDADGRWLRAQDWAAGGLLRDRKGRIAGRWASRFAASLRRGTSGG